jgi:hypothetical protein
VRAVRLARSELSRESVDGRVLCHELRGADGARAIAKGAILSADDVATLAALPWDELLLLALDSHDVHEEPAGARLAAAAAGDGVQMRAPSAGHWPLVARTRGLLDVERDALDCTNAIDGVCVYTLYDGQVVDAGEVVARAKIAPFAIAESSLARAESHAREAHGLVSVRPFAATSVGAVVQESLGERAMARFRDVLGEKLSWFGATMTEPEFVPADPRAIAAGLERVAAAGARIIALAGSKSMDPLDPAFDALALAGARLERHGVPAHPGSLFWLAYLGDVPVLGMPTCGIFSRATVFDLVLPRVLAGERITSATLAALGHGGMLTREMAFRFPPYRDAAPRGEVG